MAEDIPGLDVTRAAWQLPSWPPGEPGDELRWWRAEAPVSWGRPAALARGCIHPLPRKPLAPGTARVLACRISVLGLTMEANASLQETFESSVLSRRLSSLGNRQPCQTHSDQSQQGWFAIPRPLLSTIGHVFFIEFLPQHRLAWQIFVKPSSYSVSASGWKETGGTGHGELVALRPV